VTRNVCCTRTGNILRSLGLPYVNFFSIDVEGAESIVIDTMDWTIPVELVLVETDTNAEHIFAKFRELGLEHDEGLSMAVKNSDVFVNRSFAEPWINPHDVIDTAIASKRFKDSFMCDAR